MSKREKGQKNFYPRVFISFSKNFLCSLPKFSKNQNTGEQKKKKRFPGGPFTRPGSFRGEGRRNTAEHEKKESPKWEKISLIFSKSRRGVPPNPPARAATDKINTLINTRLFLFRSTDHITYVL
jgi:hypothetical protein